MNAAAPTATLPGHPPAASWADDLGTIGARLAASKSVPRDIAAEVTAIVDRLIALDERFFTEVDPYPALALERGAIEALRALRLPARDRRDALRVAVERMRQALRDIAEEAPVAEDRDPKEVARWLTAVLDVAQRDLARLIGVGERKFQRWISQTDTSRPQGEDARRLRVVARAAGHLRHALSGPGVVAWFSRPHPAIGDETPAALLDRPEDTPLLLRLAAGARSNGAA